MQINLFSIFSQSAKETLIIDVIVDKSINKGFS